MEEHITKGTQKNRQKPSYFLGVSAIVLSYFKTKKEVEPQLRLYLYYLTLNFCPGYIKLGLAILFQLTN